MRLRIALLGFTTLALASCGTSPKTHYFTLDTVPGTETVAAIAQPVTVAAVHVPPALDRREMMRRTGANTVEVSGQDRWTAPLGEMTRRVLSRDLAKRLPPGKLIPPGAPAPPHVAEIVVSIADFGPDGTGKVRLDGSWSLLQGGRGQVALRRDIALAIDSSAAGGADEAAAMSRLLGRLATKIAEALAQRG